MLFTMSTPSPPVDDLEPQGWSHNWNGEITEGRPQGNGNGRAYFKHSRPLQAKDVWRMRVEVGGYAFIGFATEHYNAEKHGETYESTAYVVLEDGSTVIDTDISQDGQYHSHHLHRDHLGLHPPEAPLDLARRGEAVSNGPQIHFNDDEVWHDFAPDRDALKAGPWFPYLELGDDDRLSDHSVHVTGP
jgi:hypothetical protein